MRALRGAVFPSLEGFYAADDRRRRSAEVDYGVWWQETGSWPRYRVSYVVATGELYAVRQPADDGVELLGLFVDRHAVDRALAGWADVCGQPGSLDWARTQARVA